MKSINDKGGSSYKLKFDVSDEESVSTAINQIIRDSGKIDILINNAGITRDGLLMRMKASQWDEVLNTNLKGVFLCTKNVSKFMIKQRSGKIINITSIVGLIGNPGQACPGLPIKPTMEVILIIFPLRCFIINLDTFFVQRKTPFKFVFNTSSH